MVRTARLLKSNLKDLNETRAGILSVSESRDIGLEDVNCSVYAPSVQSFCLLT